MLTSVTRSICSETFNRLVMIRSESSGDSDDECGPSSEGARKRRYHFITATRNRRSFDGIIDDETRKVS